MPRFHLHVDVRSVDERDGVVGEQLSAVLELGVDGFTCNLPADGHDPDNVELLGQTASKVLGL